MFSPNMVRFIIDPDNITEKSEENRKLSVEKEIFRYSILDHEKVLSDYNFFTTVLSGLNKVFGALSFNSVNFKECEVREHQK